MSEQINQDVTIQEVKPIDDFSNHAGVRSLFRRLVFITFGIIAYTNPVKPLAWPNIVFGLLMGLVFGALVKGFYGGMLGLFNPTLKKEKGKKTIKRAVEHGMIYMIPFAILAAVANYYLRWSLTGGFLSTAMMTAGGIAAFEIGRLRGKPAIKNTILASGLSFIFSTFWLISTKFLAYVPNYIDGAYTLIKSLSSSFMK